MRRLVYYCGALAVAAALATGCGSTASSSRSVAPEIDPADPMAPTLLMQQAQALLGENKVDEAIKRLEFARQIQPRNPTILNFLGVAEMRRDSLAKALDYLNQALSVAPTYSDARNNRGVVYRRMGQRSMAESDFLSVLSDSTYANRAGVLINLGSLYMSEGNYKAAEENLHHATMLSPPPDAFFLLGQVEHKLGNAELAEKNLFEASRRAPERTDIALALAEYLEEVGRPQEAVELYKRILDTNPSAPEAEKARAKLGR